MVNYCRSPVCLSGKTVIVTGANTGIGYQAALDFASRGARVILACRNQEKANEARNAIVEASGNKNVIVKLVDLESLASVRAFADDINGSEERLDILLNNAGAAYLPDKTTEDGLQLVMAINYFAPFLLTHLLIDLLKKSAPSRIVNVSSEAARFARSFNVDKVNEFNGDTSLYCKSKLCNIYFTQVLAKKLEGTGVTTYSLHPGGVHTELQRHTPTLNYLASKFFKTPEEGAQTSIYLSVERGIEEYNGRHFADCKPVKDYCTARDKEKANELWRVTESMVKLRGHEKL